MYRFRFIPASTNLCNNFPITDNKSRADCRYIETPAIVLVEYATKSSAYCNTSNLFTELQIRMLNIRGDRGSP